MAFTCGPVEKFFSVDRVIHPLPAAASQPTVPSTLPLSHPGTLLFALTILKCKKMAVSPCINTFHITLNKTLKHCIIEAVSRDQLPCAGLPLEELNSVIDKYLEDPFHDDSTAFDNTTASLLMHARHHISRLDSEHITQWWCNYPGNTRDPNWSLPGSAAHLVSLLSSPYLRQPALPQPSGVHRIESNGTSHPPEQISHSYGEGSCVGDMVFHLKISE